MPSKKPRHWRIDEYRTGSRRYPVRRFLKSLDNDNLSRATALIKLLAEYGNQIKMPRSKPLGGGLFELRYGQVRLFYAFVGRRQAVLLHGHIKKTQKTPDSVLKIARKRLQAVQCE